MFVDEGFGSLDEESLTQAMNTLTGLADGNRLVGIISHVADLKNRIDKQIIVKKERSGGSTATIKIMWHKSTHRFDMHLQKCLTFGVHIKKCLFFCLLIKILCYNVLVKMCFAW